jgi:hypothetical protein
MLLLLPLVWWVVGALYAQSFQQTLITRIQVCVRMRMTWGWRFLWAWAAM